MFSDLGELFRLVNLVLLKGGWILVLWALVYMFYKLYIDYIQMDWYHKQEWVFLRIVAPKENEKSPLAFEQIFNQLHAVHSTYEPGEIYFEGRIDMWFTWEIVSIGGSINNFVKIQKKHRDTLESAIYAQFPDAEISEAEDYFQKLPPHYTDLEGFDIYAFSLIMPKDNAYPFRTYMDFEHSTAETFIDPVTGIWEELTKLSPYEMFIIQYIFRPWSEDWKKKGYKLVEDLKGVPKKHGKNWFLEVLGALIGPFLDIIIRPRPAVGGARKQTVREEPPSLMLHLTEGEKDVISAVENKLSKLSYKVKIRCMYIAPKAKYNPGPVYSPIIGAFKSLRGSDVNSLKPDTKRWTKPHWWLFREWEKPIVNLRNNFRKAKFWSSMRRRFFFHGAPSFYLCTEEIATILHFPQSEVTVPRIERVDVTKVQPPPELPIVV